MTRKTETPSARFGLADGVLRFESLSGLSLGLNYLSENKPVGIASLFQSLSGLTLGLNYLTEITGKGFRRVVSIPFRADTGFEQKV